MYLSIKKRRLDIHKNEIKKIIKKHHNILPYGYLNISKLVQLS